MRRAAAAIAVSLAVVAAPAQAWTPTGATWNGTLGWWTNQGGSTSPAYTNIGVVESTLQIAYDQWEDPGCSNFASAYQGRTSRLSTSNGDSFNVHGFPQVWPAGYGNVVGTIGITVSYSNGSSYVETDVSFNEETYTFVDGNPSAQGQADLLSIAVHEFGHSLGLAHSNQNGSSMLPGYSGGTAERSLSNDDINGVCALYGGGGNPGPTEDDDYEENDDSGDAPTLSCGETIEAVALDVDWYRVRTTVTGEVRVIISSWDAGTDLDLYLFDQTSPDPIDVAEGPGAGPEIVSVLDRPAGWYWFVVNPYVGESEYLLTVICDQGTPGDDDDDDDVADDDDAGPDDDDAADDDDEPVDGEGSIDGTPQTVVDGDASCSGCGSSVSGAASGGALLLLLAPALRRRRQGSRCRD